MDDGQKEVKFSQLMARFINPVTRFKESSNMIVPNQFGAGELLSPQETRLQRIADSCIVRSITHACAGGLVGGGIGLFLSSVAPETLTAKEFQSQTLKSVFRDMKTRTLASAKSFSILAGMFGATECAYETYRGKSDLLNDVLAGTTTGCIVGLRGGLTAGIFGAVTFGALSGVAGLYLNNR